MDKVVKEVQESLRIISRYDSSVPSVIPDGIFGEETRQSLIAFQQGRGLSPTGRVDFGVWERLTQEKEKAERFFSPPAEAAPAKREDFPLKKGRESHLNRNLNLMLLRLSERYDNFLPVDLSDSFSQETETQVKAFQRVTGREETGQVDKQLWDLLSVLYVTE